MIDSRAAEMVLNIAQTERIFGRNFNLLFCSEDFFFFFCMTVLPAAFESIILDSTLVCESR